MKPNFFICGLACGLSLATIATADDEGVTRNPREASSGLEVGIARRDGVTASGGEAYVTRGKITEKLVKDLKLPSGVIARPDGSVILANGRRIFLQADELLRLDGRIIELERAPNVNPAPVVVVPSTSQAASVPAIGGGPRGTFIGSDGIPFVGTITAPSVITKDTGGTVPIDGSIRTLTPGMPNVPMAQVNADGTVNTAAGTVIYPDGTTRTKDGTIISPITKQGRTVLQEPTRQVGTVPPEETVGRQPAKPNQPGNTAPATGTVLPPTNGAPTNAGTGAAPEHPGGPAPAGIYGR